MLEFWDFVYMGIFVLVILVLKEIIEYVFITRKGGNVINIEETVSNTQTNEIGTNTRFKKKKGGKNDKVVEGFAVTCSGGGVASGDPTTNCDKATWLFCDDKFGKLLEILNAFTKSAGGGGGGSFDNNIVFDGDYESTIKDKLEKLANCISDINFENTGHYDNKIKLDAHLELVTNTTLFSDSAVQGTNTNTGDRTIELQRKFKVYTICTHDMIGLRKGYDQPSDNDEGNLNGNIYMLVDNFYVHDGYDDDYGADERYNYKDPTKADANERYPGKFHCSHRLRVDDDGYYLPLLETGTNYLRIGRPSEDSSDTRYIKVL
jgi:hypothetical protein